MASQDKYWTSLKSPYLQLLRPQGKLKFQVFDLQLIM
jgi:hypothetical protein